MNSKLIYKTISIILLTFGLVGSLSQEKIQTVVAPSKKEVSTIQALNNISIIKKTAINTTLPLTTVKKEDVDMKSTSKKHHPEKVIKSTISSNLSLTKVSFEELPGWDTADVKKSLSAFQLSCETFLKQKPSQPTGSRHIKLMAGDWHPACKSAVALDSFSEETARTFFEKWFHPIEFEQKKPAHGLFTGYYMPQMEGSLKRTSKFSTPIYGLPKNKGETHYTREQIDNGAIKKKAPVIAWIHSPIERLFLEIEGSGVIQLNNGKNIYLGYAGENGAPYTSIGKVLINKGIMTKDNASKTAIIRYLENHADKANYLLHQNKSFVYFEDLKKPVALGAKNTTLTPGYSLAVDKKWIPLGAPLWLDTTRPDVRQNSEKQLQRLMIAQDTGGAIRGFMRGDIYWGTGKIATFLGEHMKNEGHYWLLLPKHIFSRFAKRTM